MAMGDDQEITMSEEVGTGVTLRLTPRGFYTWGVRLKLKTDGSDYLTVLNQLEKIDHDLKIKFPNFAKRAGISTKTINLLNS